MNFKQILPEAIKLTTFKSSCDVQSFVKSFPRVTENRKFTIRAGSFSRKDPQTFPALIASAKYMNAEERLHSHKN